MFIEPSFAQAAVHGLCWYTFLTFIRVRFYILVCRKKLSPQRWQLLVHDELGEQRSWVRSSIFKRLAVPCVVFLVLLLLLYKGVLWLLPATTLANRGSVLYLFFKIRLKFDLCWTVKIFFFLRDARITHVVIFVCLLSGDQSKTKDQD